MPKKIPKVTRNYRLLIEKFSETEYKLNILNPTGSIELFSYKRTSLPELLLHAIEISEKWRGKIEFPKIKIDKIVVDFEHNNYKDITELIRLLLLAGYKVKDIYFDTPWNHVKVPVYVTASSKELWEFKDSSGNLIYNCLCSAESFFSSLKKAEKKLNVKIVNMREIKKVYNSFIKEHKSKPITKVIFYYDGNKTESFWGFKYYEASEDGAEVGECIEQSSAINKLEATKEALIAAKEDKYKIMNIQKIKEWLNKNGYKIRNNKVIKKK